MEFIRTAIARRKRATNDGIAKQGISTKNKYVGLICVDTLALQRYI